MENLTAQERKTLLTTLQRDLARNDRIMDNHANIHVAGIAAQTATELAAIIRKLGL